MADFEKDTILDDTSIFLNTIKHAFYAIHQIEGSKLELWRDWFKKYKISLQNEERNDADRKTAMNKINPKYVLRNYMAQLAIDAADKGDYSIVEELYELLKKPYDDQFEKEQWFAKRPEWARHKVGCSMLSCSS